MALLALRTRVLVGWMDWTTIMEDCDTSGYRITGRVKNGCPKRATVVRSANSLVDNNRV
jgi:hypothetical protein